MTDAPDPVAVDAAAASAIVDTYSYISDQITAALGGAERSAKIHDILLTVVFGSDTAPDIDASSPLTAVAALARLTRGLADNRSVVELIGRLFLAVAQGGEAPIDAWIASAPVRPYRISTRSTAVAPATSVTRWATCSTARTRRRRGRYVDEDRRRSRARGARDARRA